MASSTFRAFDGRNKTETDDAIENFSPSRSVSIENLMEGKQLVIVEKSEYQNSSPSLF